MEPAPLGTIMQEVVALQVRAGERMEAAQATLAAQIAELGHPDTERCGIMCGGIVDVDALELHCPLALSGCPWASQREMYWRRSVAGWLNIGKRHLSVSIDRVPEKIREALAKYMGDLRRNLAKGLGLLVLGEKGSGKTGIATLVVFEAARLGLDVENWYVPRLVNSAIGTTYSRESRAQVAQACRLCDLLVLDDLGVESATAWWLEWLDATIDERYREQRATVVTSNIPEEALRTSQNYGRMASRWAEPGVSWLIRTGGDDRRKKLAEGKQNGD